MEPVALAEDLKKIGMERVIVTDITRDGMDRGVNLELGKRIVEQVRLAVIVAGGVRSIEDIRRARKAGMAGIIIGRALYEGQISLVEALRC